MRLICHLRDIRGDRTLRAISETADVPISALSEIERGLRLPADTTLEALTVAYGKPLEDWYEWLPPTGMQVRSDNA